MSWCTCISEEQCPTSSADDRRNMQFY